MTNPLSRWSRQRRSAPPGRAAWVGPRRRAGAAAIVVAGLAAAVAPGLAVAPAGAAPQAPGGRGEHAVCAGYGAAAAGDLVTLRLLDLRPLGLGLPPVVGLTLATARAGFAGGTAQSAAQGRYAEGRVLGFGPPLGPLDSTAYRIAPPGGEPVAMNPGRIELGPVRAGTGNLTARAGYDSPGRCDHTAGAGSEATAALADAAVLPGDRTFVGLPGNVTTGARTGLVRHRGGTGAEAVSSGGLTHLAIFDALRARVFNPVSLRVVASGSAETSTVDYRAPVIAVDLPDGRSVQLDQAGRSFDFALPGPGNQAMPGMPVLPSNTLTELLAAVPGGAAAVPLLSGVLGNLDAATGGAPDDGAPDDSAPDEAPAHAGGTGNAGGTGTATGTGTGDAGVPESAGSAAPPMVPGIPELGGVPAVGGLLGGTGRLATTANQGSLVLRLTGGEVVKEVADSGVHAKAISLRVKLLLVRGEDTATLVDLCIGVLEVAATAPSTTRPTERGRDGYGGEAPDEEPSASPSPSPVPPAGEEPDGGGKLPVTGTALTAATGAGVVLLLAGRLLMVLARRRSPTA